VFQTNPRGVGGPKRSCSNTGQKRFRPTLVGSEEGTHWRRGRGDGRFRPTLVGSEVQPLRAQGGNRHSFRPTLVGSEEPNTIPQDSHGGVSDQPSWGRRRYLDDPCNVGNIVSDQPSWGRRVERAVWKALVDEGFRPTLVGSEDPSHKTIVEQAAVSDQPSWGRREQDSEEIDTTTRFQTNPRGVGGLNPPDAPPTDHGFQTNPRGVGG